MLTLCVYSTYTALVTDYHLGDVYSSYISLIMI